MNYELALKLKEAGFPQYKYRGGSRLDVFSPDGGGDAYAPTLSELIGACNPFSPDEFYLNTHLDHWEAFWSNHSAREEENKTIIVKGSTPEEAVANLYLTLHEAK